MAEAKQQGVPEVEYALQQWARVFLPVLLAALTSDVPFIVNAAVVYWVPRVLTVYPVSLPVLLDRLFACFEQASPRSPQQDAYMQAITVSERGSVCERGCVC
jgi:hypothetical protein